MSAHCLHIIFQPVNVSMGLQLLQATLFCNLLLHKDRSVGKHVLLAYIAPIRGLHHRAKTHAL